MLKLRAFTVSLRTALYLVRRYGEWPTVGFQFCFAIDLSLAFCSTSCLCYIFFLDSNSHSFLFEALFSTSNSIWRGSVNGLSFKKGLNTGIIPKSGIFLALKWERLYTDYLSDWLFIYCLSFARTSVNSSNSLKHIIAPKD